MGLAHFQIYTPDEFTDYLSNNIFSREITCIQNHHTWLPGYTSLTAERGELFWLESMRNTHIQERKWSDIGQNITTFKSGNIGLCRPIDIKPAGIFGANQGAICIENFGNFDKDKDVMTPGHKTAIIRLNAALCKRFDLSPIKSQVVYHHWFDRSGKRFSDEKINSNKVGDEQKTCPGTDFFGGNTILAAEQFFYPLIATDIRVLNGAALTPTQTKKVDTEILNVRTGPGASYAVLRKISNHTEVTIYAEQNDWSKISNTSEEWVFTKLLN